jgi:type III secretion protein V
MDGLLAANLALAAVILVAVLLSRRPLSISTFPTLLLITTLFRLALNVSTTRMILAHGTAGEVVEAFGQFVIRGDVVVGLVVFLIITLVQFLVIGKGAERVAEVGARFTLDAMPGKQMSIDAALRVGVHRRARGSAPARRARAGVAVLRRHGRRDEVREGRCRGGPHHHGAQPGGRPHHRRGPAMG